MLREAKFDSALCEAKIDSSLRESVAQFALTCSAVTICEKLQEKINKIKKEMDAISKDETELKSSRIEVDQQLQKWEDAVKDNSKKVSYWKREIKKLVPQEVPGEDVPTLPELSEEEILDINMEELNYEITAIDENLAKTKPNMAAIAEYKKKEEVKHISSHSCRKY